MSLERSGVVIRGIGGFFDVMDGESVIRCKARGVFRKRGTQVFVGDKVIYEPLGTEGILTEVLPRRTQLVRPPIANVDQVMLVFSLVSPDFQSLLLDRMLVASTLAGIDPCIVISKTDLGTESILRPLIEAYQQAGYLVIPAALKQGAGTDEIRGKLDGKISVLAGPSGAGKSTLANTISQELALKMGEVSAKIGRGKHTTRHVELYSLGDGTWVADAPGFSQLHIDLESADLRRYYPEFLTLSEACAYRGCLHLEEEECRVRSAAADGTISALRYENYKSIYYELRGLEERRY